MSKSRCGMTLCGRAISTHDMGCIVLMCGWERAGSEREDHMLIEHMVVSIGRSLKRNEMRILWYLANQPSMRDYSSGISKSTAIPFTTVTRCLGRLCELGLVKMEERRGFNQYYRATEYGRRLSSELQAREGPV